ncbi:hypothetical protein C8T65DRAFT_747253 [Cerioporus squamosus]|nr:hypothetical protein C8T65DRAFT_747253 [Cerioporus squamosus]
MLPPLSPLWTEAGVPLETLDAYSAAGVVEQPENIGDWGHSRSGLLAFGMERVEHTTDSEANVASRQPTGPSHDFRNSAKTLVDRSPQARRHRRRPLVVSNPDQRHQLDLVLSLISERERAAAAAEDCAPAQTGPRDSCASADATTRSSNAPPSPCRRRRRRPMLVVSNPDEKDPMQCRGVGLWRGVDVQACM